MILFLNNCNLYFKIKYLSKTYITYQKILFTIKKFLNYSKSICFNQKSTRFIQKEYIKSKKKKKQFLFKNFGIQF